MSNMTASTFCLLTIDTKQMSWFHFICSNISNYSILHYLWYMVCYNMSTRLYGNHHIDIDMPSCIYTLTHHILTSVISTSSITISLNTSYWAFPLHYIVPCISPIPSLDIPPGCLWFVFPYFPDIPIFSIL